MTKRTTKINKTLRLDPALLDEAKKVLGYHTYTETIEKTLRAAINNTRFWHTLGRYKGKFKNFKSLYE